MSKLRLASGVALLASGVALSLLAVRTLIGDRAGAEAALRDSQTREVAARAAEEQRAVEAKVREAAEIKPLLAALSARVDGRTLVDLFDSEDWWRPYRDEFPIARVIVGDSVLATRGGAELGNQDAALVTLARKRQVGSGQLTVGNRPFVVGAARLLALPEREPVLLLGRPATPPPPAGGRVASVPVRPLPWAIAGAVALAGVGLLVSGRRPAAKSDIAPGGVVTEIPREPTSKFGTPARPRPAGHDPQVAMLTPPVRGRITDGTAVSIPGSSGLSTAPQRPAAAAATAAALATAPADPPGVFGRYRLVDRLGEGGMSELFIAEAAGVEGFTRTFVLKRLRPELARDKEAVAQFIDEARMQASLVHSNIVPVFDFGVVGGEYFMTQEYIVGRDLARLMARHYDQGSDGLPPALAYYIAHETLQALAYAHDKREKNGMPMGIVHRDISAGNVMVSLLGEVKLSDFGIVKSNRRVSRTQVGMVKGNANFMSPEQARGQPVDSRSDLFSLGHVLFYCLTGQLLYTGQNDLDILYRASGGLTGEDWTRIRSLPDPAGQILEKAMALDPAERFQTATEFADALAAHTGGGKTGAAKMMQELFSEEIRRETS